MATTVSKIQIMVNRNLGDTTTNSVSTADRLGAITEAIGMLYNDFEFDFTNKKYQLDYFDTINSYNITSVVPAMAEPIDIRREKGKHTEPFTRKTPRELSLEIDEGSGENALAIEQRDRNNYLMINYTSENIASVMHNCDNTSVMGEIELDKTTSDAINLTFDKGEFKEGNACINFDLDIDQSANQRMTVVFHSTSSIDMTEDENVSSLIWDTYLPDVIGDSTTVMVGYWGKDSSNYWTGTITTDIDGSPFANGWNKCKINWADTTKIGTPNVASVGYLRLDINHNSSADDTDFRIDNIIMVKPEKLNFHYQTWYVGVESTSTSTMLTDFYSTSNIPFYSGLYDFFDTYVAHQAAAILFRQMGQMTEADREMSLAQIEMKKLEKKFPKHTLEETSNFKIKGLKW